NCAQCHRPGGTGPTFDARYDTPLTNQNIINGSVLGNLGYDNARVVTPKDVWRSILYQRASSTDPLIRMPQLARNLVDTNAMSVVADWINSLPGTPALPPPSIVPGGGTFSGQVTVALLDSAPGVTIRYTLDGSLPDTNSVVYSGPFVLSSSAVLLAKAFEDGFIDSVATHAVFSLPPSVFFTPAEFYANGMFQMQLSGMLGKTYVLEATTDFSKWSPISTNVAPANVFNLLDAGASNYPARFYRIIQLP
ncbi:MAG TPA: chitobiase/beta-hexosaminidase C-terminal domain-containing protein, partial [Verrucomicrobiae bacterium]|nr:chitobiase/beta-hexosaminidase C-terminal domain-containing protein [Verrucomicrobiae bacterium]